jgi:hypothetical protein
MVESERQKCFWCPSYRPLTSSRFHKLDCDYLGSVENEYAWKKLSSTLENDYKIYAYRVDAIHSITYNILHAMSRRQQDIDALQTAPA